MTFLEGASEIIIYVSFTTTRTADATKLPYFCKPDL